MSESANPAQSSPGDAPFVSVIVIGYNQQGLAPLAVQSVLAQTHRRLECIFVDDGSQDATFERVDSVARADARLRALRKENGGPPTARNFGAAHASPEASFIAFLDGDDLYRPQYLDAAIRYLNAHPQAGTVIPFYDYIDAAGAPLPNQRRGYRWVPSVFGLPRALRDSEPNTPFVTFYCGTGAIAMPVIRLTVYRETEGWDTSLLSDDDCDLLCQLALISEVHYLPEKLTAYRIHGQQITATMASPSGRARAGKSAVQEKWNARRDLDRKASRIVERACIYFRQIHLPLRSLRVSGRALLELLGAPSWKRLEWLGELLRRFLRDFIYYKVFFWRSTRRYVETRFHEARGADAQEAGPSARS